jgi:undecaprenyl diphosphate synthase
MELITKPRHVAIIPDGNRRWAREQGLEVFLGHEKGADQFWEIGDGLLDAGASYVTVWVASIDNLTKRTPLEIKFLVSLIKRHLANPETVQRFIKRQARVRVVGKWNEILEDQELFEVIRKIEKETEHFPDKAVTILFGYNGTTEMLEVMNHLSKQNLEATEENVEKNLWTPFLPVVDLVIRTGGEPHWSAGFMMWLTANSQFYFTETLWPAFNGQELNLALEDFAQRQRRFGK